MKIKKIIYLVIALTLIAGLAFAFSQSSYFKGGFSGAKMSGDVKGDVKIDTDSKIDSYTSAELAEKAEDANDYAKKYNDDATSAASEADTALSSSDATALSTAQSDADYAAKYAENYATRAQTYADKALEEYDAAWERYDYITTMVGPYETKLISTSDFYFDVKGAWDNYTETLDKNRECEEDGGRSCDDDYDIGPPSWEYIDIAGISRFDDGAAVDDAYTDYQTALTEYQNYVDSDAYTEAADKWDETKSYDEAGAEDRFYKDDAQESADSALAYATSARASSDAIALYTVGETAEAVTSTGTTMGTVNVTVYHDDLTLFTGLKASAFTVSDGSTPRAFSEVDGVYTFKLNYGDYTITVTPKGYVSGSSSATVSSVEEDIKTVHKYAYNVILYDDASTAISGATVTAGDDFAVTCAESTRTSGLTAGLYECAVPFAHTETGYKVVASGYDDYTGDFSANFNNLPAIRTAQSDPALYAYPTLVVAAVDADSDADGYTSANDCDDADATVYSTTTYYVDADGDGLGDSTTGAPTCSASAPTGYVSDSSDTNDSDYDNDGVVTASDCNDKDSTVSANQTYYSDSDGDGLGDSTTGAPTCSASAPTGYVSDSSDTNDSDYDNDGVVTASDCNDKDSTVSANQTYYSDSDSDGLGNPSDYVSICTMTVPSGYVSNSSDTSTSTTTTDTDKDGLTDYQEQYVYGTDLTDTDTDADNLSDYEEVKTFGTDPNDSDTDGDGIPDGTEVKNGTDPLSKAKVTSKTDNDECSDPFTDMKGHWAESAVCILYEQGIVKGLKPTIYSPDQDVTRAEFLKMIMLQAGYDPAYYSGLTVTKYSDVNTIDWHYNYVALADKMGFLWYPAANVWQPNAPITRGDAMLLSVRIAKLTLYGFTKDDSSFKDFDSNSYQAYAIVLGEQYGVIKGYEDGTFKANNKITRAEAAKVINSSKSLFE